MKDENNRNLLLAIALSLVVLLGWQYFIVNPRVAQQQAQQRQTQTTQQTPQQPGAPATPQSGPAVAPDGGSPTATPTAPGGVQPREAVIAATPRVAIDTPRLGGSISLRGGRIDDLVLRSYRETVNPSSPNVTLFNPQGAASPFYAEVGTLNVAGVTTPLPTPQTVWTREGEGALRVDNPVTLTWDNGQGLTFRRTYAVDANYMFTVTQEVRNASGQPVTLHPYALVQRDGTPQTQGMWILHEGPIGVLGTHGLHYPTYSELDRANRISQPMTGGWLGITDKYWAAAIVPDQATPVQGNFISTLVNGVRSYQSVYYLNGQTVQPGASQTFTHRVYAGARDVRLIDGYQAALGIDRFELLIDWGWFYFITKPLFFVLEWFFHLFGNFGVSILIVTLIIKLLFFPLANKSYESMARMKKIQPELLTIRERFADDKMKQQQAMMELYKKEKINPLSGCLPILVQIPVFFALYKVLFVSIEMRHAPFFGWIRDLSAHDPTSIFNLFGLLPFAVPEMLQIGVWPIIMGITMWLQMKMNPEPPDQMQRVIFGWMPVIFTFMLASFPAGLVIYWAWNNLLSIAQQWLIMKRNGVKVELFDNIKGMFKKKPASAG